MKKKSKPRVMKRYAPPGACPFCKADVVPDYKEYKRLASFLTPRSAVTPKKYSGVCSKHQRMLGQEIKRARNLGLLPFIPTS